MTIDYFLNDYIMLVGGKFLSPVGQFRQNLHPSWINKLASAPPGFGHDGAAPTSDVGVQARGGFQMGDMFTNYAVYASNGPELNATFEDDEHEDIFGSFLLSEEEAEEPGLELHDEEARDYDVFGVDFSYGLGNF